MYHFIEALEIDELVDISHLSETEQEEFLGNFIETAVANTYTHYLEDPEIPNKLKEDLVHMIAADNLEPDEHQELFASKYMQVLYQHQSYSLKVECLLIFLADVRNKVDNAVAELKQPVLDYIEYLESVIALPEQEQEPELEVMEAWQDFKAICIAQLGMFKNII